MTDTERARGSRRRRGGHGRRLGVVFRQDGWARAGRRPREGAWRARGQLAGGRDRAGPGRDAGDGRSRALDDRLLQRPAGGDRDRLGVPRAGLPDPRGDRRRRARRPGTGRDAAPRGPRCPLAVGGRSHGADPDASPRRATAAAASSRPTAASTRRGTSGPTRSRCRRRASSSASGPPSPGSASSRPPTAGIARRRRRDVRRTDRHGAGAPDRRTVAAIGRTDRRAPDPGRSCPPHGLRPRAARGVRRRADADGLRHRRRDVLAARGRRPPVRLERPGRGAGRGAVDQLADVREGPRATGRPRAGDARARHPEDLGGDDRLHARPSADRRARPDAGRRRGSTASRSPRRGATG